VPLRARLRLWLPVALMMAAQVFLSSQSRLPRVLPALPHVDKLEHGAWFCLLGLLAFRAVREGEGWSPRGATLFLVAGALAWGVSDEWHQSFVPGRSVEGADVAADVVGAALAGVVAEPLLRRLGLLTVPR
jgi:VanZ family protein